MEMSIGVVTMKNIVLPYDPVILLMGIYLKILKTLIWKDSCPSMFIAVLFIIAKTWKQTECSSIDERTRKIWYI